jgi:DNA polymerase sigma
MEKVICVSTAKVPIVKIWDPELRLSCDMNVNNPLALENTRMIKTYVQIDDRVRPLAMIVKHWTKQRIVNDAGKHLWTVLQPRSFLILCSFWWHVEFIHMDMHDHIFPPNTKPSRITSPASAAPYEATSKGWD